MTDPRFFINKGPFTLAQIAQAVGITLPNNAPLERVLYDVAPLDRASTTDLSFFDNPKYIDQFRSSTAGACFVRGKYAPEAHPDTVCLITDDPYRAYALAAQLFYPAIMPDATHIHPQATIDPSARLGKNIRIDAGAVIGCNAEIADGCHIGANAVIGQGVIIGEKTSIGALSSLSHCIIGARAIIHRGVHIGQDGFGFAMGRAGHLKVPQLGRVLIEDDVEIGSGTTIDRGTGTDTHIGAGTKIDNLVQIGHNVHIGKGAVIVALTGISGSSHIGDGAVLGGQVGLAGHISIGAGARLAAQSGVINDVPPGKTYGGTPAVPIKDWHRQSIMLSNMSKKRGGNE